MKDDQTKKRTQSTLFDASFHMILQSSLGIAFGLETSAPVFFLDSDRPVAELAAELAGILRDEVI